MSDPSNKNMSASVRARLLNLAKATGEDFQAIVLRYAVERFLTRLAMSPHRNQFVLKGAMLYVAWKLDDVMKQTSTPLGIDGPLLEKIGMGSHPLKNQALAVDFVNEQPIRFDVAVPSSLPISDKLVVAVNGVQRLSGEQGPRDDFEFLGILSTAQATFNILFKLTRINGNKHVSKAQILKQVIGVFAYHQIAPGVRFSKGALSRFAGDSDVKRQTLMQLNLFVEKGNRLCGIQADPRKYFFRALLEFRFNPGSDHCAFAHKFISIVGSIVAQMGYKKPGFLRTQ